MPNTTQEEFQDWRKSPVTREVMQVVRDRIEEAKNSLITSTNERDYDLFIKGMIQAFNEVLTIKFSDEQEDKNEV